LHALGDFIERRNTEVKIEQALAQAKTLLWARSFDAAISVLSVLRAEFPNFVLIEQWLAHAEAQKVGAERQTRLRTLLGEARSLLSEQRFAEAVAKLENLGAEFPDEASVQDLLAETLRVKERVSAIAQAKAQCDQFLLKQQFDKALEVVDVSLASYHGEPALITLRQQIEGRRLESESAAALRPVLDEAEWLLKQDRPDLAVQLLREKKVDFADQPALVSRLSAIEQTLPDWQKRRFIQQALARADALEQRNQWQVALTVVEEALDTCPTSVELLQASERLRDLLQSQERARRLARQLEVIGQKIATQAWSQALSLIEASQTEFPGEPKLQVLAEDVQRDARRSQCESFITEVRQCLADDDTLQAEEILREGLASFCEEPALTALRAELEADKKYREDWRAAQVLFGRRQFEEAERILVQLAAKNRPDAQTLLETVREARVVSEEEDFYKHGREKALKLIQERRFQQAADLLSNLLTLFPGDQLLERALRSAQNGRHQGQSQDFITESKEIGDLQPPEPTQEAMGQAIPALSVQAKPSITTRARSAVLAFTTILLLVSGGAVVWTLSRGENVNAAHEAQGGNVTTAASVDSRTEYTDAAPTELPLIPGPGRARVQAFLMPSPPPGGTDVAVFAAGRRDNFQRPKFIAGLPPVVPSLEGGLDSSDVNLEATVDQRGMVTNVTVLSGRTFFVSAATLAVLKWQFDPAVLNGHPLEYKVRIRMTYKADGR
jgi:hypothetical protein